MPADTTRTYSAAHFALELDNNQISGFFKSIDGGGVKTEHLKYQMGNTHATWMQLGKPKYEAITIEVAMAMSNGFYTWIENFFAGKVDRRTGAIVAADFQYYERARRKFMDAIISEVSFPTVKADDKNSAHMKVKIEPGNLRWEPPNKAQIDPTIKGGKSKSSSTQQLWTAANFEFAIGGFEDACARCTSVDGFTIKQQVIDYHAGHLRDPLRVPGLLEYPNVTFSVPEADAKALMDHFTKYAIGGKVQPSARLTAGLTIKDHKHNALCIVNMAGVEIANATPTKRDSGSDAISEIKFEIAVESMTFEYKAPK
jgi:phage tail-like protein